MLRTAAISLLLLSGGATGQLPPINPRNHYNIPDLPLAKSKLLTDLERDCDNAQLQPSASGMFRHHEKPQMPAENPAIIPTQTGIHA